MNLLIVKTAGKASFFGARNLKIQSATKYPAMTGDIC